MITLKRQGHLTLVKQVISIIDMQKPYKHVISLASMAFGFRLPGLGSFLVEREGRSDRCPILSSFDRFLYQKWSHAVCDFAPF